MLTTTGLLIVKHVKHGGRSYQIEKLYNYVNNYNYATLTTLHSNVSCGWLWFLIGIRLHNWLFQQIFNKDWCKVLDSLILLSFLCLTGFEKQNTVGAVSDLSVALFGPNTSTMLETKSCPVKWWLQTRVLLSYIGGSSNHKLFSYYWGGYACKYVQ